MKLRPLILFPIIIIIIIIISSTSVSSSPTINVWPQPWQVHWRVPRSRPISPSFFISASSQARGALSPAIRRCKRLVLMERHRPLRPPNVKTLTVPLLSLSISVANPSAVDESHSLSVPLSGGTALLSAASPLGAIWGLETFSQLVWLSPSSGSLRVISAGINITDRPLFPHRGLLLDTSRNFFSVKDILRTVRALAYNKMNVLHWHVTDSQSFPIELPSVPELAAKGAYSPTMTYSADDVRRIVRFAASYGVRVIPEIDMPGHAGSWARAHPEIVTCANEFWLPANKPALAAEPAPGQLNPLNPSTYDVVRRVLRDATDLFPDPLFHGGADEVTAACWDSDPSIAGFISSGGTHDELLRTFINATRPFIVGELNRTVVYWEDIVLGSTIKIPPSDLSTETTILQTWNNGPNNTKILAAMGFRVVVSSWDFYYLDCGHGGWLGNDSQYDVLRAPADGGSWCAPFKTWQRIYDYDIAEGLTDEERKMVIGGEVALWSEQADGAVIDGRVWPRASAMAESLWSGNRGPDGKKRYSDATDRLVEWRHRMVHRGIAAEPIQPLWCAHNPGMCNLVQ